MPPSGPVLSLRDAAAGVGGGLASVLMFYSAFRGGAGLGFVLLPLMPLPTLIAGFGWGLGASLTALLAGVVVVAAIASPSVAAGYALLLSVPAAGVAHMLALARHDAGGVLTHWYPIGRVVLAVALYGAALPVLLISLGGGSYGVLAPELIVVVKGFAAEAPAGSDWRQLSEPRIAELVAVWLKLMPAMIASYWTLFFVLNVYLAGRVVRASRLLDRPWPDLHWMSLPAVAALGLCAAIAGVWVGGSLRMISTGALGALAIAFLLQGLSVIHAVARTRAAAGVIASVYAALIVVSGLAIPLMAALGVGETLFHLRRRLIPVPADLPAGSL